MKLYVEQVLQINANLASDDDLMSDAGSDFDSPSNQDRGDNSKKLHRQRSTTTHRKEKQLNKDILNRGTPINVDFRAFILPPAPQDEEEVIN